MNKDHARKIVEYRNQNGPFSGWENLNRVPGIQATILDSRTARDALLEVERLRLQSSICFSQSLPYREMGRLFGVLPPIESGRS